VRATAPDQPQRTAGSQAEKRAAPSAHLHTTSSSPSPSGHPTSRSTPKSLSSAQPVTPWPCPKSSHGEAAMLAEASRQGDPSGRSSSPPARCSSPPRHISGDVAPATEGVVRAELQGALGEGCREVSRKDKMGKKPEAAAKGCLSASPLPTEILEQTLSESQGR